MVSLTAVKASNARIATTLPASLVAVFVGGTNGIGEYTLKAFAKHASKPRVYFVGRSQEAADRITAECRALNPDAEFIFLKADTSLIRNIDDVCRDIKAKETTINLLVLTMGTLAFGNETSEGMHAAAVLVNYGRNRFTANLLPLLQRASGLRRVLTVFAAGKEGPIKSENMQGRSLPLMQSRGHAASLVTLSLEALAEQAPGIAFVHDFPGFVKSGILRGTKGPLFAVAKVVGKVAERFAAVPTAESGERHLFLATSARYPSKEGGSEVSGVPLADGVAVAQGTTGKAGSGVYGVDWDCESVAPKVQSLLDGLREQGMVQKVWENNETEWERITGSSKI